MGLFVPLNGGTIALGIPTASDRRINQQCVGVLMAKDLVKDLHDAAWDLRDTLEAALRHEGADYSKPWVRMASRSLAKSRGEL